MLIGHILFIILVEYSAIVRLVFSYLCCLKETLSVTAVMLCKKAANTLDELPHTAQKLAGENTNNATLWSFSLLCSVTDLVFFFSFFFLSI